MPSVRYPTHQDLPPQHVDRVDRTPDGALIESSVLGNLHVDRWAWHVAETWTLKARLHSVTSTHATGHAVASDEGGDPFVTVDLRVETGEGNSTEVIGFLSVEQAHRLHIQLTEAIIAAEETDETAEVRV